ncbi:MAG: HEAT repeat domain-containing protein [Limisphaerales bacterium]
MKSNTNRSHPVLRLAGWRAALLLSLSAVSTARAASLDEAPPVVVKSFPVAGSSDVDPGLSEISVTFSKTMIDGSWSWATWKQESFPEMSGKPRYQDDRRTCVLPVKLKPESFYAVWINSEKFRNFKDTRQLPAVPYLLTFSTGPAKAAATSRTADATTSVPADVVPPAAGTVSSELNADQRAVLDWTDRQFRSFFDGRTFDGWSAKERTDLEARLIDTLKGPVNRDYYLAINSLAALRSTNALPALRTMALEHRDKNNRDRWMAIRALGLMDDRASIPDLIHLVYHGNSNTRWWAQISLVRMTGKNFGSDWKAWGDWWNSENGKPPFRPEIIRWWNGQAEPDQLAASLAESDQKFLAGIRP